MAEIASDPLEETVWDKGGLRSPSGTSACGGRDVEAFGVAPYPLGEFNPPPGASLGKGGRVDCQRLSRRAAASRSTPPRGLDGSHAL